MCNQSRVLGWCLTRTIQSSCRKVQLHKQSNESRYLGVLAPLFKRACAAHSSFAVSARQTGQRLCCLNVVSLGAQEASGKAPLAIEEKKRTMEDEVGKDAKMARVDPPPLVMNATDKESVCNGAVEHVLGV